MYFEFGLTWDTDPAATVPAFHFNSGSAITSIRYGAFGFIPGGSAIWHLSGGAFLIFALREFGWIDGNPITDDGGGDEAVEVGYWDANTVLGVGDARPRERVMGTTAVTTFYAGDMVEGLDSLLSSPGKIPVYNTQPGGGFISTHVSEAMVKSHQMGQVVIGSATTLIGAGIIFTGITHDTMTSFIGSVGWVSVFDTAAVIGDAVGWATTTNQVCHLGGCFFASFYFHSDGPAISTAIRGFWGLTGTHVGAARAGAVGTNTPTGDLIGIQVRDTDVNYFFLTQQNGGAPNRIDTGVALTTLGVRLIINARGGLSVTLSILDDYGVELFSHTETTPANLPLELSFMGMAEMIETRDGAVATLWHTAAQISLGEFS